MSEYVDRKIPATLQAARILIENTIIDVYNLPENAPNRAIVLEDAIRLKESLDKAEAKMKKLWVIVNLRESRKVIAELEANRDALEGNILASTTEFMRLQAEVKKETNNLVSDIHDTHRRNQSFEQYIDDFNKSLDLRVAIARRNMDDPGPSPGQIQSPLVADLYLDLANELAAERNAAVRQARLEQQEKERACQWQEEKERNRQENEPWRVANCVQVQPITLAESDTEQVDDNE